MKSRAAELNKNYQQSVFMAAMLEEQNNKIYLHKNKTFLPVEKEFYCFLFQHGRCEHTLLQYTSYYEEE